jgi:hypothetical protein
MHVMPAKARSATVTLSIPNELDAYEPLRILSSVGDAFHRYTWKHDREYGQADPDEAEFRCGAVNDQHFRRLHALRQQWVQSAVQVDRPAFEARRAFDQLMDAFFEVRKAFHGLKKYWHNWKDNPYNPSLSTLASNLGLKLTASEREVEAAAEANNAPIRDQVHSMITSAIAAARPIADDIHLTKPLLAVEKEITGKKLGPTEFDFEGRVVGGFSGTQLQLLATTWDAGKPGISIEEVLSVLKKTDDVKGRKALNALRRRAEEVMKSVRPRLPYGFIQENGRLRIVEI